MRKVLILMRGIGLRILKLSRMRFLFPKTTEEVQKIVQWARENKISLIPSGGRTGLSGGATATNGEVVVSLEKMNKILDYDPVTKTARVEAGVITEQLQDFAKDKGDF